VSDADAERRIDALRLMRAALDVTGPERATWLDAHCGDDAALRAEVDRLLAADAAESGVLDQPLGDHVARGTVGVDPRIGRRIGPYVLVEAIGRGGMGVVYRGERDQGGFTQSVAIKLLRAGAHDDVLAAQRFARERQILVRLQHPHIARLLDGGIDDDGQPWYAMEYVQGEALLDWATRTQAPLRQRLQLLMQVCDAVHYAHQNLVLHRDLKPANILVDASGEAKLLDFGIAKLLDDTAQGDAATRTRTEQRAFTPAYAAPEQMAGGDVSTATDLYALGVILYELLTGLRPLGKSGVAPAVTDAPTDTEAPSRRVVRERGDHRQAALLRGDLDVIALTCLQHAPARRYASAAALKRDLERHLAGLPIEARADSVAYRAAKFLRRHRYAVAAAGIAALALIGATGYSLQQAQRAEHASAQATAAAAAAQRERDAALDEARRQETLREHFVAVLNRAAERATPIQPQELLDLAADPNLLGAFGEPEMHVALQLALADLFAQRDDYTRALSLLDQLAPVLATAPPRIRAKAATIQALGLLRVGRLDESAANIELAETWMTPAQRAGGMLLADIQMLRAQLFRAQGDLAASVVAARAAADQAFRATDGSALERGRLIGSGATSLLLAGELDGAIELTNRAEAVWSKAGVAINIASRVNAANRANALFLRGDLVDALAAFDAIDARTDSIESPPARAARDLTHAKLLALLGRGGEAVPLADAAINAMCDSTGATSVECLRARLATIDTRYYAGQPQQAQAELARIGDALAAQPPLAAAVAAFERVLRLQLAPDDAALAAVVEQLSTNAQAGALPRRNAVRAALMLAEIFARRAQPAYAQRLARAALDIADDVIGGEGMDASLLLLWQARLSGEPVPAEALGALARAVGADHALVAAHRDG